MRRRGFLPTAAIVASLALLVRLWTRTRIGILPTHDSFDYLQLARRIAAGDWGSERLGTMRLPGYPVLLALLERCSLLDAGALLTVQQTLGAVSAVAFAWCAWRFAGPVAAIPIGCFVAMHPVLLLFEHQPMSETLYVASLALVSLLGARVIGGRRTLLGGLALGLAVAASLLIRANGGPLVLALLMGCLAVSARAGGASAPGRRSLLRLATGLLAGLLTLLGPWFVRQSSRFGRPSLIEVAETRLIYLAQHRLLDPTLPRFQPYRAIFDPDRNESIYDLIGHIVSRRRPEPRRRLFVDVLFESSFERGDARAWSEIVPLEGTARGPDSAETSLPTGVSAEVIDPSRPTRALLSEQLRARPQQVPQARLRSLLAFLGFPAWGDRPPWGQQDLRYWLFELVPPRSDAETARIAAQRSDLARLLPGADSPPHREGERLWSRAGLALLVRGRPALVLALVLLLALPPFERPRLPRDALLAVLVAAFFATAALHGWMLAGYERFAVPFDPVLALAVALAARRRWPRAPRRPRYDALQRPNPPVSKSSAKIAPGSLGARQEG